MPKAINELKAKYEDDIGQLNKKIVELQLRLDDRERRRREHEEEVRVKNERINNIAGLIATGNVIAKSFEEKNDKDLVKEQYLEWERDASESLASSTFGLTYLAPFGSAKGTGTSLMNHKIPGVNASHSETVRRCPALNQREHNGGASCAAPLGADALFVDGSPENITKRQLIVELAAKFRLPANYAFRSFVEAGGLMSYGTELAEVFRQAARSIDNILRGTNPGDVPYYQPTKFKTGYQSRSGQGARLLRYRLQCSAWRTTLSINAVTSGVGPSRPTAALQNFGC